MIPVEKREERGQGKLQAYTWVVRLVSRILLARGYSLKLRRHVAPFTDSVNY